MSIRHFSWIFKKHKPNFTFLFNAGLCFLPLRAKMEKTALKGVTHSHAHR